MPPHVKYCLSRAAFLRLIEALGWRPLEEPVTTRVSLDDARPWAEGRFVALGGGHMTVTDVHVRVLAGTVGDPTLYIGGVTHVWTFLPGPDNRTWHVRGIVLPKRLCAAQQVCVYFAATSPGTIVEVAVHGYERDYNAPIELQLHDNHCWFENWAAEGVRVDGVEYKWCWASTPDGKWAQYPRIPDWQRRAPLIQLRAALRARMPLNDDD